MTESSTGLTRRKASRSVQRRPCSSPTDSATSRSLRQVVKLCMCMFLIPAIYVMYYKYLQQQHAPSSLFLSSTFTLPDNEPAILEGRLPASDKQESLSHTERLLACMPTVTRKNVEYVSNAVKSWRLATNLSIGLGRLVVIDMDVPSIEIRKKEHPEWLEAVLGNKDSSLPSWLIILKREGVPQTARKVTLGDSLSRITWRSKEAQDYAQVLSRCAKYSRGQYVLIVQDDVLFTTSMKDVVQWADSAFVPHEYIDSKGHNKVRRVCSLSLFDVPKEENYGKDLHMLDSSNMVARIWRTEDVERVVSYISRHFDEAPVDWLVDDMCKIRRRVTLVKEPNAVRHRGVISSFAENDRRGLLT